MTVNTPWTAAALSVALALALPLTGAAAAPAAASGNEVATQVDSSGPFQLVQTASNAMLKALDAHRAEYRQDPSKLRELVNQVLLPHFDTDFAGRLVLGRHWTAATADQRQRFIDAFYKSMLNNYGEALLDFTANRMQVLPYRGKADAPYATVNTRVRKADGSLVSVNYSLRKSPQGWKVWDVVIEGISYDKSFQQDFGEQIDHEGLDAVITRLEHGETPDAIKQTTASPGGGK